jgi:hypothetical protein
MIGPQLTTAARCTMEVVMKKTARSASYYLVRSRRDGKRVRQEVICYLGPATAGCDTLDGAIRYCGRLIAVAKKRIAEAAAARNEALGDYRAIIRKEIAATEKEIAEARGAGGGAGWLDRLNSALAEHKQRLREEPVKPDDANRLQAWWCGPRGQACLAYWQHDENLKRATRALLLAQNREGKLKTIRDCEKTLKARCRR